ncbi:MAG: hypothetical protein ACRDY0_08585 [Acidimicrobiales bacterium]
MRRCQAQVGVRAGGPELLEELGRGCAHLNFVFDLEPDPILELTAARLLLVMMDELRSDGVVVRGVRVELVDPTTTRS